MPPRFLSRVYGLLLYAYPADFRRRYGAEMARVFRDHCRDVARTRGTAGWLRFAIGALVDWLSSAIHEWTSIGEAPQLAGAAGQAFGAGPVFHFVDDYRPARGALAQGVLLSLVTFAALSYLPTLGGQTARARLWLVGSHHPSRSHLLHATTAAKAVELNSEVKVSPYPDEPAVNPYFRLLLVLAALDADHDNVISAEEIANAPAVLRALDSNGDGKLSAEECGLRLPREFAEDRRFHAWARRAFMWFHPVLRALDTDHDGEISSSEIRRSPAALATLDRNHDGRLTLDELLPLAFK